MGNNRDSSPITMKEFPRYDVPLDQIHDGTWHCSYCKEPNGIPASTSDMVKCHACQNTFHWRSAEQFAIENSEKSNHTSSHDIQAARPRTSAEQGSATSAPSSPPESIKTTTKTSPLSPSHEPTTSPTNNNHTPNSSIHTRDFAPEPAGPPFIITHQPTFYQPMQMASPALDAAFDAIHANSTAYMSSQAERNNNPARKRQLQIDQQTGWQRVKWYLQLKPC